MANERLACFLKQMRTVLSLQAHRDQTDADLLDAFTGRRDEGAFAALVQRHGRMVLGVCRHVLGHEQDAEDAFQATFLVLAQRAGIIRGRETLCNWLHGVAYRTAMRAKRDAGRRRLWEKAASSRPMRNAAWEPGWREVQALLEEEIHRLPSKFKAPFVLCHLEGKSRAEAAIELRCPEGTFSSRLNRACQILRKRLARRGITLSTVMGATAIAQTGTAALPVGLATATVYGALAFGFREASVAASVTGAAAGQLPLKGLSAAAILLAERTMKIMLLSKALVVAFALSAVLGGGGAVCLLAGYAGFGKQVEPPPHRKPERSDQVAQTIPTVDESLPKGAVMRLVQGGTSNAGWPLTLAFTPDSKRLVAGSWDGLISVWDLRSHRLLKEWDSMSHPVRALALSPNGAIVAAAGAGANSETHLWSASDGKLLKTLEQPQGERLYSRSLIFSPDGNCLISAGGSSVRICGANTGKVVYKLNGPIGERIHIGGFSRDGSTLTLAYYEQNRMRNEWSLGQGQVVTVDLKSGKENKNTYPPDPSRDYASIGYTSSLLSTGKWMIRVGDYQVWLNDIGTGRKKKIFRYDAQFDYSVSPDERLIALSTHGQPLKVVELATGQVRNRFQHLDEDSTSFAFAPDGRTLACGKGDRSILVWDLTGRMESGKLKPALLSDDTLARAWQELQALDGETTNRAVWQLVAGGADAVSFLGKRIRPKVIDPNRIAALMDSLASQTFQVRDRATRELEEWGEVVEASVRKKLEDGVTEGMTLEVRRRLEQVLAKFDFVGPTPSTLRAVEVLEHIGNPEARQLLRELAVSETTPRLADEASRALARLEPGAK